jgi:hypothetical protein
VNYVHLSPDSICALLPHRPDGLLWPRDPTGFKSAGLTYFAIQSLPTASPGLFYNSFNTAGAKMNVYIYRSAGNLNH